MRSPRLGYLDALRGFAALYVVIFHIGRIPTPLPQVPDWLTGFVDFGGSGVTLFFVISGFSMAMTWGHHVASGIPVRHFYITRLFRIAPLFYLWLVLTIVRDAAFKGSAGLHGGPEIFCNLLFAFNLIPRFQNGIVWASWTIGVEMMFYLVFPAIMVLVGTSLSRTTGLLMALAALVLGLKAVAGGPSSMAWLVSLLSDQGVLLHLPAFLAGMVAFRLRDKANSTVQGTQARKFGVILGMASLVGLVAVAGRLGVLWYDASICCYGSLLVAASLLDKNPLVNRSTTFIGKISYSLYLNHPNIVYLLAPVYATFYRANMGATPGFLSCIALTLLVLAPVSYATFRVVEQPFISIGKKLAARQAMHAASGRPVDLSSS